MRRETIVDMPYPAEVCWHCGVVRPKGSTSDPGWCVEWNGKTGTARLNHLWGDYKPHDAGDGITPKARQFWDAMRGLAIVVLSIVLCIVGMLLLR